MWYIRITADRSVSLYLRMSINVDAPACRQGENKFIKPHLVTKYNLQPQFCFNVATEVCREKENITRIVQFSVICLRKFCQKKKTPNNMATSSWRRNKQLHDKYLLHIYVIQENVEVIFIHKYYKVYIPSLLDESHWTMAKNGIKTYHTK